MTTDSTLIYSAIDHPEIPILLQALSLRNLELVEDLKSRNQLVQTICCRLSVYHGLAKLAGQTALLGDDDEDSMLKVLNWVEWAATVLPSTLFAATNLETTVLTPLHTALARKTFLVMNTTATPTMADWLVFSLVVERVKAMTPSLAARFYRVVRWAAYLQYLLAGLRRDMNGFASLDLSPFNFQPILAALNGSVDATADKKKPQGKLDEKSKTKSAPTAKVDPSLHPMARVDLRVGKIIKVEKHPNADRLYIEQVDLGEDKPRTVVSGLVEHVSLEELQDRLAVFICNLKPATICKTLSSAMLLVSKAEDSQALEPLKVPEDALPGDQITLKDVKPQPDSVIKPKDGIWDDKVKGRLSVINGIAHYDGNQPLTILRLPNSRITSSNVPNGIIS